MRIYAVADIHCRDRYLERAKKEIADCRPDLVILAGDISSFFKQQPAIGFIENLFIPCAGILGNSDFSSFKRKLLKINRFHLLDQGLYHTEMAVIHGISGTIPLPFASKISLKEKRQLSDLGSNLSGRDILVVHPPPRGMQDKVGGKASAGSSAVKQFIDVHAPLMVICGHIHEQAGVMKYKKTTVVNCAMNRHACGVIIDMEPDLKITTTILTDNAH